MAYTYTFDEDWGDDDDLAFGKRHTESSSLPHKLYAVIDNRHIIYSCRVNQYVLPIILYSWVHAQYGYDKYVETNLALIQKTLAPHKRASDEYPKIKATLDLLSADVPDHVFSENDVVSGFASAIGCKVWLQNITPTTLLQYYSFTNVMNYYNGFTMIYIDEYYYLLEAVHRWNYYGTFDDPFPDDEYVPEIDCKTLEPIRAKNGEGKTIEFTMLMNLYAYLKMRIRQYESFAKLESNKQYDIYMRESIDTLAELFGRGNRTISRYVRILIELGMIGVNGRKKDGVSGKFIPNVPSQYWLSDKWTERLL